MDKIDLTKPKTRLMTWREIMAKILTMDKEYPFLVGEFDSRIKAAEADHTRWNLPQFFRYGGDSIGIYYRHIHQVTGEWISEPRPFLIGVKEGE